MGWLRLAVASVALVVGTGCADDHEAGVRSVMVAKEALGDHWPFVVDSGSLRCQDGAGPVRQQAATCGLMRAAREEAAPPPFPIWVWAGGPALDRRVSLAPLVERGLALCE